VTDISRGDPHMLGQERLDAVGAEPAAVDVGEQRARIASRRFLEPCLEGAPCVGGQWRTSFLPSFADTSHMRSSAEVDGVSVEADQLRETQACLAANSSKA
jgi:hypothetical protein